MFGQLGLQASLQHRLDHLGQEAALTGQLQTAVVDLLKQLIQQPGLDHRVDRLTSRPRLLNHT